MTMERSVGKVREEVDGKMVIIRERICTTTCARVRVPGDRNQPCSMLATYGPPESLTSKVVAHGARSIGCPVILDLPLIRYSRAEIIRAKSIRNDDRARAQKDCLFILIISKILYQQSRLPRRQLCQ